MVQTAGGGEDWEAGMKGRVERGAKCTCNMTWADSMRRAECSEQADTYQKKFVYRNSFFVQCMLAKGYTLKK